MQELLLMHPSVEHTLEIAAYKEEFIENGDSMDGTSGLARFSAIADWLTHLSQNESEETVQAGLVPSSTYLALDHKTGRLVGMIDIRHRLNDHLLFTGGHIGYSVRKSERRKGYATQMLRQGLTICRDELHLSCCLVTCNSENIASSRTIEANGGVLENIVADGGRMVKRYWIAL